MSESSNLIPNLNEIMEEYVENEEEAIQEVQSGGEHETEKTRKRKRGAEEAGTKQRKEKVSDFVAERAYFAWRDKLQHKDFISERGFSKLISPFVETIEKRG